MSKQYSPLTIANYFLDLADKSGEFISPMKLQKLIYFAHGLCLAIKELPLINESIEAWKYGPVIPSVYEEFKKFGGNPITKWSRSGEEEQLCSDEFSIVLLKKVWAIYGSVSAIRLSEITHLPNAPWDITTRNQGKSKPIIKNKIIKSYFKELLDHN